MERKGEMMPVPSELISFDFKPHMQSMLVKSFGDQAAELQKLEDFVARLEEERLKIDAFKRELPLCMQLLTNGMLTFSNFKMKKNPISFNQ